MIETELQSAKAASRQLLKLDAAQINEILLHLADRLEAQAESIIEANATDLAQMDENDSRYDRLVLNADRIAAIANDTRNVASLPSPLNKVLMETRRPNGMVIRKVSVPFGVIGVIYEARPNVTIDVFSLCLKAGSVCILKGGKEAKETNCALVSVIHEVLSDAGLPEAFCTLLPNDHEATTEMLTSPQYIDLVIPRGSSRLIQYVRENAKVPVIETGAGVCHTYFDKEGDLTKGKDIVMNGKTRRISVCNALDCLIIHEARLGDLPELVAPLQTKDVELLCDEASYQALDGHYNADLLKHASPDNFGMEMLAYRMAIKTVSSLDDALDHIAQYSSKHSEAIVSEDKLACQTFLKAVDAACVYQNLPTSWTDGSQFGFGAEIGISTQKLHARGPMGLPEITTYKYVIGGNGQIRE